MFTLTLEYFSLSQTHVLKKKGEKKGTTEKRTCTGYFSNAYCIIAQTTDAQKGNKH